ncbi:MAG: glycosyltransferase family 4 protein [Pseudomonadota bacterium]
MRVKSVLIASDFACINGGQAKVAIDAARLLADAGVAVTFFAAVGPADPLLDYPGITVEILGQNDILSEPSRLKAVRQGLWNAEARDALQKRAAQFDPQTTVLHCHGYAKALSPAIGPILKNGPLRAIYTMHEYFLACPNGGFFHYPDQKICTRKPLGLSCLTTNCDVRSASHKAWRVARQALTWGPGQMPRGLSDLIYISKSQRSVLEPYLPKDTTLHYVPNPIAQSQEDPVDAAANDAFLFIGRLNPEKGGKVFAQAAKNAGVRAVFVGDGPQAAQIEKINPEAEILGWQTPEEVQTWIGRARAVVFPSLWYETFGLVPFEALARGVPVVCGRWNAASDGVSHGKNGILYDSPDAAALTKAIQEVKSLQFVPQPEVLAAMSPEAHVAGLIKAYDTMLAR